MSDTAQLVRTTPRGRTRGPAPTAAKVIAPASFWHLDPREIERQPRLALKALLMRIKDGPPTRLYDAVELGVPTRIVPLLAGAFGGTSASFMSLIGVSETTFRRKEEAGEPLPEVAGHRVMGLLRIVALLVRLLEESGDPQGLAEFDLEAWVGAWLHEPLPALAGKTPAEMLRNPEGQRLVEEQLQRMRGGLPA